MRLQPDRFWKAGEQRLTPVGTVLPGVHRSSYWNYTRHLTKNEELSALLASLLESISANKNFIREINSSGGYIEIDIQFNGGIHSGDIFHWEQLAILSEL